MFGFVGTASDEYICTVVEWVLVKAGALQDAYDRETPKALGTGETPEV